MHAARPKRLWGVMLVIALVFGCATKTNSAETIESATPTAPLPHPAITRVSHEGEAVSLADIAQRAVHAVVNVSSTKVVRQRHSPFFGDPFFRFFFHEQPFGSPQMPRERREKSLGSGVLIDDGVVVTNNHVVEDAEEVVLSFDDGKEYEAQVVGTDHQTDLAVLRVEGGTPGKQPMALGDSSELRLGDVVLAVGNPFGMGHSVTMGIVSATGRANVGIADYEDFIQTDAAINPGNSGGALVNMRGELVGINTAILSRTGGYQGIGFAIPTNMMKTVVDSLLDTGKVVRGWLGVSIQDIDDDLRRALGLDTTEGVLVSEVLKGSPAEKAGVKQGDVIVSVDGKKAPTAARLRNLVAGTLPGHETKLTVIRDGKERTLLVELGTLPDDLAVAGGPGGQTLDGMTLGALDTESRSRFGIDAGVSEGVVVVAVDPGSLAERAGLRPGDVIREVSGKRVSSPAEAAAAYRAADEHVLLLVRRGERTLFVAWTKPSS